MKFFKKNTLKKALLTCLTVFAATFCSALGLGMLNPANAVAKAETLSAGTFKTDGASVRVFEYDGEEYKPTSRKGIRFHVEMGAGYTVGNGTVLFDTETKHERGSFTIAEGYTTKTLVIPTRLLTGELTLSTAKVMAIDTTEYWFADVDGNWESVAYVYNVPEQWYTDSFTFRGIVLDANGNVVAQSNTDERSLAWVAKQAYYDTIEEDGLWGDEEKDAVAEEEILKFIPQYQVTYNGVTETVLWGDKLQNVPTGEGNAWYDTENSEEIDVNAPMTWADSREIVLVSAKSENFVLTGVAEHSNFVANGISHNGFKVYVTLDIDAFTENTEMDIHAVNIEHKRGGALVDNAIALNGVWTLKEMNSHGQEQMRLFFSFDTTKLASGDEIVIKGDSIFYANGVMYKLTEDYVINYAEVNGSASYGIYLGELSNADVAEITNCAEDASGKGGEPNEFTLRVTFHDDVMVSEDFVFEYGEGADTSKAPVYIRCGEDPNKYIPIYGGRYYWENGQYKILELIGAGEYENKVFGWHSGDELIGQPGTIVKQNGGYYVFKDQMYAYFLESGTDKWDYVVGSWVVGTEVAKLNASSFATTGSVAKISDYGVTEDEARINTANHWFNNPAVNMLTVEKMLDTAP